MRYKNVTISILLILAGLPIKSLFSQQPSYYETYNEKVKEFSEKSGLNGDLSLQSSETLKNMTLHVIPQSHIDLAWWWRYDPHSIDVVIKHTLETAFENMEKFPEYTFTFLQVPSIEPLEDLYPDLFYKLQYYIHNKPAISMRLPNPGPSGSNGRLAIGSALYCEFDGSLPCGESLVRHCLYGKRYYKHQFGINVKNAWFQDAWTHPWTLPQILKKCGIESYMYTRPRPSEKYMIVPDSLKEEFLTTYSNTQNDQLFWWEGPDGSRVFAYKPLEIGGENLPDEKNINQYLLEINRKYGVTEGLTLIGVGNHGGGAIAADVDRMCEIMEKKKDGASIASIKFSKPEQFVSEIINNSSDLPVIKSELYPTIRGIYTTVSEIKTGNRAAENLLITLEKFASIAKIFANESYPQDWINSAWNKVMLNQFHDTISGTDISPSIEDALKRYEQVITEGKIKLDERLKSLTAQVNTKGRKNELVIVVFNPLSWDRKDFVEIELQADENKNSVQIRDNENNLIPVQILKRYLKNNVPFVKILFEAEVPSLGYASYWAKIEKSRKTEYQFRDSIDEIENKFFHLTIDTSTGLLKSIYDKSMDREILNVKSGGNKIQIFEDYGDAEGFLISPKGFGEYYLWPENSLDMDDDVEIELIESGPVRTTVQIKKKFKLARFIQQIHLYSDICRVDFDLVLDWNGKNKMVKVAFPLTVNNDSATYEVPYGTISRPSIGEEHVAQKWVDISNGEYGVSLLNDSRYGHDITSNMIRLSVLRSPDHPVNATDEKGIHHVKYAIYPHKGDWKEGQTMHRGYEFNYPLIAVTEKCHAGILPSRHSFIVAEPENVIVSVLKKAEDSEDLILRFFETHGVNCEAKIKFSPFWNFDAIHLTDLLENEIKDLYYDCNQVDMDTGEHSIESVKLIKDVY